MMGSVSEIVSEIKLKIDKFLCPFQFQEIKKRIKKKENSWRIQRLEKINNENDMNL